MWYYVIVKVEVIGDSNGGDIIISSSIIILFKRFTNKHLRYFLSVEDGILYSCILHTALHCFLDNTKYISFDV